MDVEKKEAQDKKRKKKKMKGEKKKPKTAKMRTYQPISMLHYSLQTILHIYKNKIQPSSHPNAKHKVNPRAWCRV
jgi:hypothetical protein